MPKKEVAPPQAFGENNLGEVSALATMLKEYDAEISAAEESLKELKEHARRIREESLPMAMQALGLDQIKLSTGEKISIKLDVYASIPAAQKNAAYEWLERNEFGSLIKTELSLQYGRDNRMEAKEMFLELQERGLSPEISNSVHASTLKAFLKEQLQAGAPVPLDLFGARPVYVATIK